MNKLILNLTAVIVLTCVPAFGQISIGPSGNSGVLSFNSAPPATEWSSISSGTGAANYTDVAGLEAGVLGTAASSITDQLQTIAGTGVFATARWNSTGLNIFTRATTVGATLLMASVQNNSGTTMSRLTIAYTLGGTTAYEDVGLAGHRVYYSLTGAANSWVNIPALNGDNFGAKSATIELGSWANTAIIYLLWVDDNGVPGTDGAYTLDDVLFTATGGTLPLSVTLHAPATSTMVSPANVTVTATPGGSTPATGVYFYTNNVLFATLTTAPYTVQLNALPPGAYTIHVEAENGVDPRATSSSPTVTVRDQFIHYTGGMLTENFDSMGPNGTNTPIGWYVVMTPPVSNLVAIPSVTNLTVTPSDGSDFVSSTPLGWNYGLSGDPDRALGTAPSGTDRNMVVRIQNNAGSSITAINFTYDGEVWRNYTNNITGRLTNYVSLDLGATWITTGFNFAQPFQSYVGQGAVNGNLATNRTANIGGTFTLPTPVAPGGVIYIRWYDFNDLSVTDGGLAIDNFRFAANFEGTFVTLTEPINGAMYVEGTAITVSASAGMPNPVASVDFFHDNVLIGTATNFPFSVVYSNATVGSHALTATAHDTLGNSVSSTNTVIITVNPNTVVSVTFTNQAPNSTYLVGSYITNISVNASTSVGNIARVEFYLDGALLVSDTTSPYSFDLCDAPLGAHAITAIAVDSTNGRATNTLAMTATNPPVVTVIVPNGATWKYLDTGVDQGTAWRARIFDDSSWSNGVAELGYGDGPARPERTVVRYGTNAAAKYATTYFRKSFQVSDPNAFTNYILRILRDDHAIVYLNGTQVYSDMTNIVVTYTTYEPPNFPDDGTVFVQTNVSPSLLITGANVLAVEVHQDAANSSDVSFDAMLWAEGPVNMPLTNLNANMPQDLVSNEFNPAQFIFLVAGTSPIFQWFKNNVPITIATNSVYTIASVSLGDAGNYFCIASNSYNTQTSRVATLTVLPNSPPTIVYTMMNTNGHITGIPEELVSVVTIQFSEPVMPADVTNLVAHPSSTGYASPNFFITREGNPTNNTLHLWKATLDAAGTNLTLIVEPKQESPPVNYRLYVGNIRDRAPPPNAMPATSQLMNLRFYLVYCASGMVPPAVQGWRYNWTGTNLGTAWKESAYNDKTAGWQPPAGQYPGDVFPAPFFSFGEDYNAGFPTGWGDPWVYAPFSQTVTTYYYRTTFNLPTDPAGVQLQFEILADDGAVFWLNGSELRSTLNDANNPNGRFYMTNGTEAVLATTFAIDHDAGVPSQRTMAGPMTLLRGVNTLAVEVHQSAADIARAQPDHVFALQIIATTPPLTVAGQPSVTQPPQSVITNAGATVVFTAMADGALPLTGRWYLNQNNLLKTEQIASSPGQFTLTRSNVNDADAGSYTLTVSNSVGSTMSAAATLTVLHAPAITAQPTNITAPLSGDATFRVNATGTLPLSFQWYFNATTPLSGQTSATLALNNLQLSQDGLYSVIVANSAGSITSVAARLTVLLPPNPRLTQQPQSLMAHLGGSATFTVLADGDSPFSYQWRKNGASQPGATNNSYTLTNLQLTDAGGYSVIVTNPVGSVTSAVATLVVTNGWYVTTFAGSGVAGHLNAVNPLAAQFNGPNGIVYSPKFGIFVGDGANQRIRAINAGGVWDWAGSGVAGSQLGDGNTAQFNSPLGLAIDAFDQLFVADTENHRVLRINATGIRTVALLAGSGQPGLLNGTGVNAYFNYPVDCVLDGVGNVCVAEFNNHVIRRVSPFGEVTLLAGAGVPGYRDGPAAEAQFVSPSGIARDAQGNLYVADWDGQRIRKIATNGVVSTLAGSGVAGFRDGVGTNAQFNLPDGVCVDYAGNVYVVEHNNNRVRRITAQGEVTTVAGTGVAGYQDGAGVQAQFSGPAGICALPDGSLLVSDAGNQRIRKVQFVARLPVIVAQPYWVRLLSGETLNVKVVGAGDEPLAYQWYLNGSPLDGATSTNLVVANLDTNQAGYYGIGVSNWVGTSYGVPVEVRVGNAYFAAATAEETAQLQTNGMKLRLALIPGANLELQFKNDLNEPTWQVLTNFNAVTGALEFLDSQATNQPRRFYRLWKAN